MCLSPSVVFNCVQSHGLWPARLLCPWNSPGKNHWIGMPFPSPGDLPNPGIKPGFFALQADSILAEPSEKPTESQDLIVLSTSRKLLVTAFGL